MLENQVTKLSKELFEIKKNYSKINQMHEIEVKLRLEYEQKLNTTRVEFREIEGRFRAIATEFDFNVSTTKNLYIELSKMKDDSNELIVLNNNLRKYKEGNAELTKKLEDLIQNKDIIIKEQHDEV